MNDSDQYHSQLIMKFFKGKNGIKIYDKNFDPDKILKTDSKIVIDINENSKTKGVYINVSKNIHEKIKNILSKTASLPFIGKRQANKNKKLELDLLKKGSNYCYIEFPNDNFENKVIITGILKILKKIIESFK